VIHKVALLSTPWPLFNRPSIQLGTLKAYLRRELPDLKVDAHHLYLSVAEALGYDLYKAISKRSWLSEACYAALLYPEREEVVQRFWKTQAGDLRPKPKFKNLCRSLKEGSERVLRSVPWSSYPLIGFSICYGQLTSSLYFIRQVKKVSPHSRIVVGGSSCAGRMGESLLRVFPEIDFVVNGEGEIPLLRLVKSLASESDADTTKYLTVASAPSPFPSPPARGRRRGEGVQTDPSVPGLLTRSGGSAESFSQVARLDDLPSPDFTDYFENLKSLSEAKRFLPKLPIEMSRGCWWGKKTFHPQAKGCAFCNLNLQWKGYRSKSLLKVVREIDSLTDRYGLLSVSFMDNLLPPKNLQSLFETLARIGKDFRLFAEIRATTSLDELLAMGAAGVDEVQVGIEALSTRLLGKLNKGTTAIQNLEIMKNCEGRDTPDLTSNLITHFPGSDERDVGETLNTLQFAVPFRPLTATPFWLGYGSPVFCHAEAFGIRKVFNHPFYSYLFPREILSQLHLMLQGYEGTIKRQQRLWAKVVGALKSWRTVYDDVHSPSNRDPILSYQDGGTFLIIRERRPTANDMTHRLRGSSRQIYLFCEKNRSLSEIVGRFPRFGQEKILPFLNLMVDKKLMFREGERYLSLAVPVRGFSRKYEIRISKSEIRNGSTSSPP
jgi:ribosomal peptide maturation radical SAM protein 1